MTQEQTERVIADLGLPDQAIQGDELPWVPQGEWVARPGTLVYEPPGDIHTLVVDEGVEEMQTLFVLEGTVQYIDDNDDLIYQDDVFSKLERYLKFCDEQGIEPQDLRY